jgi:long-subunit acyl-CoA synthetase (AMP-forming)
LFISVPRLLNRFYDIVNSKFKKTEGIQKILLDRALSTKL